ncbi:MAG: YerC/YecD family TrpR-related protein [Microgenomates group bacterium]
MKTNSDSSYPTKEMNELFDAILTVKTKTEAANFFRDLLTIAELKEFANRWQIVIMVEKGVPYLEIAKKLNVSTTTVSRVAHWLHEGRGGYRHALNKKITP